MKKKNKSCQYSHGCVCTWMHPPPAQLFSKVSQLLPGMLVTVQGFSLNPQYLSLVGTQFICYKNRKKNANTFLKVVFCGVDMATRVTANHFANPSLSLFFLSACNKVLPQNTFVCPRAVCILEKDYLFICFLKRLMTLGIADFKQSELLT